MSVFIGVLVEMPEVFEKVCELADSGSELANYLIELAIYLCELENSERQIKNLEARQQKSNKIWQHPHVGVPLKG